MTLKCSQKLTEEWAWMNFYAWEAITQLRLKNVKEVVWHFQKYFCSLAGWKNCYHSATVCKEHRKQPWADNFVSLAQRRGNSKPETVRSGLNLLVSSSRTHKWTHLILSLMCTQGVAAVSSFPVCWVELVELQCSYFVRKSCLNTVCATALC